jgi:hypothetical protein
MAERNLHHLTGHDPSPSSYRPSCLPLTKRSWTRSETSSGTSTWLRRWTQVRPSSPGSRPSQPTRQSEPRDGRCGLRPSLTTLRLSAKTDRTERRSCSSCTTWSGSLNIGKVLGPFLGPNPIPMKRTSLTFRQGLETDPAISLLPACCHGGICVRCFKMPQREYLSVDLRLSLVEVRGFEPLAPAVRRQCSTGLSYTPETRARVAEGSRSPRSAFGG